VLVHYNFIDNNTNLLFKGEVSREITNVDKIVMTELLFSGILKKLTNEEILALFSVLSPQIKASKADECTSEISPQFSEALMFV
jgi:superfamily II RNA helicase